MPMEMAYAIQSEMKKRKVSQVTFVLSPDKFYVTQEYPLQRDTSGAARSSTG